MCNEIEILGLQRFAGIGFLFKWFYPKGNTKPFSFRRDHVPPFAASSEIE